MPGPSPDDEAQPPGEPTPDVERATATGPLHDAASILSAADDAILQSVGGRFIHVNRAAEQMFGYRAHELVGHSPLMLTPADRAAEIAAICARVQHGEMVRCQTQRAHRDGTVLDVSLTVLPIFDDADQVVGETSIVRDITDQMRMERHLQEADARIRSIFDHIPAGLSLRDLDGRYLHVNRIVSDALGAEAEQLVGRHPADHHAPSVAGEIRAEDQMMLRTGMPVTQDYQTTHADGSARDYCVVKYPVRDEQDQIVGFGAFSLDVTESKRVEHELRIAEQRLRMLLEAAPDAVVVVSQEGMIMRLNAKAEEMFGHVRRNLLGEPVEKLLGPDLGRIHAEFRHTSLDHRSARQLEATAHRRNGSEFPLEMNLAVLPADEGTLFLTVIRDITRRKNTESAHAEALELFRRAFTESPVGIVLLDVAGRFERVNSAFSRMVGYSPEQLRGKSFESITHPDDITNNVGGLLRVLSGEKPDYVAEKRYIHASGHDVTVSLQTTLLRAENGAPLNFLTHVEDITDDRRREQQLAQLSDHDALTGLLNRSAFAVHSPRMH